MRRLFLALPTLIGATLAGCPHEAPAPPAAAAVEGKATHDAGPARPSYVLADPDHLPRGSAIALEAGSLGVLVDGARIVARPGEMRTSKDLVDGHLVGVDRVPPWLGGGFLFRARDTLYLSDAFDGALRPVAG